jgi:hypothetical protein
VTCCTLATRPRRLPAMPNTAIWFAVFGIAGKWGGHYDFVENWVVRYDVVSHGIAVYVGDFNKYIYVLYTFANKCMYIIYFN